MPLAGCAGSPARNMIDLSKARKAAKAKAVVKNAEDKILISENRKGGFIFEVTRDAFRGSVPCNIGTLVFKDLDTGKTFDAPFRRLGSATGPWLVTVDPGTYFPIQGSCNFIVKKTKYKTTRALDVPFLVSSLDMKLVTVAGGEFVFPGRYRFNQVKDSLFSFEYVETKNDYRSLAEKRFPDLDIKYRTVSPTNKGQQN
jgi:hypothetical protein